MNACKRTHKTTCHTNTDSVVHGNLSRFRKFLLFSSILTEGSILANPSKPHISVKLCPARMTGPSYLLSFSNASIHHLGNVIGFLLMVGLASDALSMKEDSYAAQLSLLLLVVKAGVRVIARGSYSLVP